MGFGFRVWEYEHSGFRNYGCRVAAAISIEAESEGSWHVGCRGKGFGSQVGAQHLSRPEEKGGTL